MSNFLPFSSDRDPNCKSSFFGSRYLFTDADEPHCNLYWHYNVAYHRGRKNIYWKPCYHLSNDQEEEQESHVDQKGEESPSSVSNTQLNIKVDDTIPSGQTATLIPAKLGNGGGTVAFEPTTDYHGKDCITIATKSTTENIFESTKKFLWDTDFIQSLRKLLLAPLSNVESLPDSICANDVVIGFLASKPHMKYFALYQSIGDLLMRYGWSMIEKKFTHCNFLRCRELATKLCELVVNFFEVPGKNLQ